MTKPTNPHPESSVKASFECDYNNGAHPAVLQKLLETNNFHEEGYGFDTLSEQARKLIRAACRCPKASIYFLTGGTQANKVVIDSLLKTYEGVVCADTGHINVHESGAIESAGHRVIALPSDDGKLLPATLKQYVRNFGNDENRDHAAQPGMVYITYPTELGTLYTKDELQEIAQICREQGLHLYIDGARLGYGLASPACDITLEWLSQHCDAMTIGGTKTGALCGEAVVFPQGNAPKGFFSNIKRHGALLAKGRLIGAQFVALFSPLPHETANETLYSAVSRHAIDMAMRLKEILIRKGYTLYIDSPTNQQFVVLGNHIAQEIAEKVRISRWEAYDEQHTVCRFVTSWATTRYDLEQLEAVLPDIKGHISQGET